MSGGTDRDDETIGGLFSRLAGDARDVLRAEANVQSRSLLERVRELRTALILIGVALLLVLSSLTGVLVGCVLGLARWIGPVGAGIVVTLVTLALAGLLVWLAVRQISAAGKARSKKQ